MKHHGEYGYMKPFLEVASKTTKNYGSVTATEDRSRWHAMFSLVEAVRTTHLELKPSIVVKLATIQATVACALLPFETTEKFAEACRRLCTHPTASAKSKMVCYRRMPPQR